MGPKIELKYLISHKQGTSLENMYLYVTVVCSLHNLIMSDLMSKNIKNNICTLSSDSSMQMVKETKQIWSTVKDFWIKKRFENFSVFHISFVLLLYVPYIQNFLKTCVPAMLLLEKNWGKMAHLPQQQGPVGATLTGYQSAPKLIIKSDLC